MSKQKLTHLNNAGEAHMVDIGSKDITARTATAAGQIITRPETLALVEEGRAQKGDVIATARIAGIMAAKKTADLIPLCHPLALTKVSVDIKPDRNLPGFVVEATTCVSGKTGVEMEALAAVSTTCLTLYDMLKAVDRGMVISDIRLLEKHGGKSGSFTANG